MAAPTFISAGTINGAINSTNISWGAGHQADDIGVLLVHTSNQALPSTPSGWTPFSSTPVGTGTAGAAGAVMLTVFWKRATSSTEAAASLGDSGDHQIGQILVFRGCETTGSPIDAEAADTGASSTSVTMPGVTTTGADRLVVACAAQAIDGVSSARFSAWTNVALTGFTEITDSALGTGTGGGFGAGAGVKATAGAVGSSTATLSAASAQARLTFALKPPGAVAVTVTPGVGDLALTGFAPAVLTPRQVIPGLGQLTVTGFAPTVLTPRQAQPGVGALVLTGFAPTIIAPATVQPGAGQIVLTGFAPTVTVSVTAAPGVGALTLTGLAPTVRTPRAVVPGVGSLALTGFAPAVLLSTLVRPGAGALTLTGFASAVAVTNHQRVSPEPGALALTGYAPTVLVGGEVLGRRAIGGFRRVLYEPERKGEEKPFSPPTPEAAPLPEPPSPPARIRAQPRVTDPVRTVRLPKVDVAVLLDAEDEELLIHLLAVLLD